MRSSMTKRSRTGLSTWLIVGIIAALGVGGYLWYKHSQNAASVNYGTGPESYRGLPTSLGPNGSQSNVDPNGQQYAPGAGMPNPYVQNSQSIPTGANALAPETTDPELKRLYEAFKDAELRLTTTTSGGDVVKARVAQKNLDDARTALNAKKASMLKPKE